MRPQSGARAARPGLLVLSVLLAAAACEDREEAPATRTPVLDMALALARPDHPGLDEAAVRAEVARLAEGYRRLAGRSPDVARGAEALRRLLFEEEAFQAVAQLDASRTLHIDTVLKERRGHCLSLSIVALTVAEQVNAPLFGVAAPNHFFVRFDDGRHRRNLELTRRGAEVKDEEYRARFGRFLSEDSVYLRNLTVAGIRACLLHNRGYVALVGKRFARARADFTEALRLQPNLNEAHRNLGVLLGEQKRWDEARRSFTRALALFSGDVDALVNLALCRHALGDLDAGVQDLEMALSLDPGHERATDLLRDWRAEQRQGVAHRRTREALPEPPPRLRPGLWGRYYAGLGFERVAAERVDLTIDFDWKNRAPAPDVPRDGFSIRWEGYFRAPRHATYTFFLVANDGCRLLLGDTALMENWRDMGYENWYGSREVRLDAGWHRLKIEHYDRRGGARILLRVGVEDEPQPLALADHLFHQVP